MGKGTDKLYITHSEWSSADAFSTSAGANARQRDNAGAASNFKRLPFNYCALSLQPFEHPVCTAQGAIFDLTHILPWIKKHGTNPVDGTPLKSGDLIKLNFAKNDEGEYVDPVTYKVFTDNTHIVALKNTGNVFSWDTVERLNIKAKNWRDLVSDEAFRREDVLVLQDPQNVESRDLSRFRWLKEGESNTLTAEQAEAKREGVNEGSLGSAAKILKAKEAVAKARAEREGANGQALASAKKAPISNAAKPVQGAKASKPLPYNAAQYSTGAAAASFTSTGLTPATSTERATLTDEEYMLRPRRVKFKGYARLATNLGELKLELYPEYAPKAVWNFVQLAKQGYYKGVRFHRNIRNFMIQGGDPTGTGKGGQSVWAPKTFEDEFEGPLVHDARGVLSMANKGKDTNTSQFYITYRAAKHLDRKHTIFGRVVEGADSTLSRLEAVEVDEGKRPTEECRIEDVVVFVDPFEEFLKRRGEREREEARREEVRRQGGAEDERVTWTGKRVRGGGRGGEGGGEGLGVGKYLVKAREEAGERDGVEEGVGEEVEAPPVKKAKKGGGGGFGNFDAW